MAQTYHLGIVGESNYQPAIRQCSVSERVLICREPDNPYDDLALRVETLNGCVIGYISKSNWVRDAVHEEGRGLYANIASIGDGGTGNLGVVLNVTLCDDDLPERSYGRSTPPASGLVSGILSLLRGRS